MKRLLQGELQDSAKRPSGAQFQTELITRSGQSLWTEIEHTTIVWNGQPAFRALRHLFPHDGVFFVVCLTIHLDKNVISSQRSWQRHGTENVEHYPALFRRQRGIAEHVRSLLSARLLYIGGVTLEIRSEGSTYDIQGTSIYSVESEGTGQSPDLFRRYTAFRN